MKTDRQKIEEYLKARGIDLKGKIDEDKSTDKFLVLHNLLLTAKDRKTISYLGYLCAGSLSSVNIGYYWTNHSWDWNLIEVRWIN